MQVQRVLLWLFIVDLGVVFGAGIYEARIAVPRWLSATSWDAEAARRDDVGRRFWGLPATLGLTVLTLVNGWAALHESGAARPFWIVAVGAALLDRVVTFSYFIPAMVALLAAKDAPSSVERARRWARLNVLRLTCVLVAWLAAMQTLTVAF